MGSWLLLAQEQLGGWLPVSLLAQARHVRAWAREYAPAALASGSHAALASALRAELLREAGERGMAEVVSDTAAPAPIGS